MSEKNDEKKEEDNNELFRPHILEAFMICSIINNNFDRATCFKLYGDSSSNIWNSFENRRTDMISFLRHMNTDEQSKFFEWVYHTVDIPLIIKKVKGGGIPKPPPIKNHFIDPVVKQKLEQELIIKENEKKNEVVPPQQARASNRQGNSVRIPGNATQLLRKKLPSSNPLQRVFLSRLERARTRLKQKGKI